MKAITKNHVVIDPGYAGKLMVPADLAAKIVEQAIVVEDPKWDDRNEGVVIRLVDRTLHMSVVTPEQFAAAITIYNLMPEENES